MSNATGNKNAEKISINDMPGIVYQAIMQSISDPFTIIDREFRLLWINIVHNDPATSMVVRLTCELPP